MAIVLMDGFDLYGSNTDILRGGWSYNDSADTHVYTTGGRFGGTTIEVETEDYIQRQISIAASTVIFQFAFRLESLSNAGNQYMFTALNNLGASTCFRLKLSTGGAVTLVDANSSTVASSPAGIIKQNVWQYMEIKAVISDTGSVIVKVDGSEVINDAAVDIKPGSATDVDSFRLMGASTNSATGVRYDDVIVMDDSGSVNNDFIGDRRIETLLPTGDDATDADWISQPAQSVGDEYLNIDDPVPGSNDGDTSYLYSATPGDESLFDFENLSTTPAEINAVQVTLEAKKSDGGSREMAHLLKADTKATGTTFNPGTDYEVHREVWEQSTEAVPGPWTPALVNAAQAGVKLVS